MCLSGSMAGSQWGIYWQESDKDQAKALEGEEKIAFKKYNIHIQKNSKRHGASLESTGVTSLQRFGGDPVCLVVRVSKRQTSFSLQKYNHTWAYSDIYRSSSMPN